MAEVGGMVEAGHLGGYIQGGDPATYFPGLWRWLVEEYGVRSVVDVGCGEGHAVQFFEKLGIDAIGVDGVPQEHPHVIRHDFAQGRWKPEFVREGPESSWRDDRCDLIWSCEFVEHVEERYMPNFLHAFSCAKMILITHAEPGQAGYHHVNCQPSAYWRGALAAIGYTLDEKLTAKTRALANLNRNPYNHFTRSGLAFLSSAPHEKMHGERRS